MQIDITELTYDSKEYVHTHNGQECKLGIRPYPRTQQSYTFKNGGMELSGEEQWAVFNYCLTSWDLKDKNGKDVAFTEENKKKIFDFGVAEIPGFVAAKGRDFEIEKEGQEKN